MYQPELARFTARDPLPENGVLVGGIPQNSYWYANNNPANLSDPSGLQPNAAVQPKQPANAPREITGVHKQCFDLIKNELIKRLKEQNLGAECFRELSGKEAGRPIGADACLAQLVPCILAGLQKLKFQMQSGGRCTSIRGGYTNGPCVDSKTEARGIGCKQVCREGRLVPQYFTDPGCGLCPDDLLEHSPVVLCLGSTGTGRDGGKTMPVKEEDVTKYCSIPNNRQRIALILIHEVLHNCVGDHKPRQGDKSDAERDKCGRPDAAVAAGTFVGNCLRR